MLNIKLNQKKLINKKMKNMKKTRISLLFVVVLALSAIPFSLFVVSVTGSTSLPDYEPIDLGAELRNKDVPLNVEYFEGIESSGLRTSDTEGVDIKWMLWYDDLNGLYIDTFVRAAIGDECEIWVNCFEDGTFNLDYPTPGDGRNPVEVTQPQLDYLAAEFDEILPKDRTYFGDEDYHDGSYEHLTATLVYYGYIDATEAENYYYNTEGKSMIMISNIGDESYYDETYPNYIAGFYWSTFEYYFDRNIINIDAYDFVHRVGEPDNPDCESWWIPDDPKNRVNLYESIIAHEYQHLIHADWFPGDETFMNEACSLFAEPLCGYEFDLGQVDWFLATPDNSLTFWGEQGGKNILADYGAAFLWALYLTDHYGFDFLQKYVQANWDEDGVYVDAPTEAQARINYLLPDEVKFDDVFHDWRLANLIHSDVCGSDKYNYNLEELRAYTGNDNLFLNWDEMQPLEIMEVKGRDPKWTSGADKFGETLSLEDPPDAPNGWPTGYTTLAPYSTDYISFKNWKNIYNFKFDGDDTADIPLTLHEYWEYNETTTMWWSGMDDLINSLIATQVSVPDNNPILELYTYWDIEDYWDFGFVQVSLDGTWDSWTSLDNLEGDTTMIIDPAAHPDAVANLPGLTGWSGDFVTITFDLSDYAGMDIYLGFRYVTDWLNEIPYYGWYIDDVLLKGDGVDPEDEDIIGDFTTFLPPYPDAEFMVSIVTKFSFRGHEFYSVYDLGLNNEEYGSTYLFGSKWIETTVVVSPINPTGYVDYQFKVSKLKKHGHGHCMF